MFQRIITGTGKRSGNVEENRWKSAQDGVLKKYTYQYDTLNRLTSGVYAEPGAAQPKDNFYNEVLTYDLGGNISTLKRTGGGTGSTAQEIDDLTYVYDGNQLQTVTDAKNNPSGYPSGGGIYHHDLNGNMDRQNDKGISNIAYNLLDLPSTVTQTSGTIQYLYRADGTKLKKTTSGGTTDYVDGFQYENGVLKFVPTSEGYFNFENNTYIYHYTDHLGNIRLSFAKNGSSAVIIEESNFYPYGMKQESTVQTNPAYNYEQSGKEYQKETGWSDFGARMYMADIGRWGVIDALAETTRRINPYNYALDNPVSYVDPDGRKAVAPSGIEVLQPMDGALGYMIGDGRHRFGSFEEFLGQGAPIGFSQLGDTSSGGGGGGGGLTANTTQSIASLQQYFLQNGVNANSIDYLFSTYKNGYVHVFGDMAKTGNDGDIQGILSYSFKATIDSNWENASHGGLYGIGYGLNYVGDNILGTRGKTGGATPGTSIASQYFRSTEWGKTKTPKSLQGIFYNRNGVKLKTPTWGGFAGRATPYIGRGVVAISAGMSIYNVATADNKVLVASQEVGGWAGAYVGAQTGAELGATIGSIFPGAGTLIGGVVGGAVGGAIGYSYGSDFGKGIYYKF